MPFAFVPSSWRVVHRGKRDYPYQSYLRLSLRHGFSRNPEGFAVHVCMGHDLRHDAVVSRDPVPFAFRLYAFMPSSWRVVSRDPVPFAFRLMPFICVHLRHLRMSFAFAFRLCLLSCPSYNPVNPDSDYGCICVSFLLSYHYRRKKA